MQQLIKVLRRRGQYIIKTTGNSMLPLIRADDSLYIKGIKSARVNINDIIALFKNKKIIAHRVVYKRHNCFITKGDNSLKADGKIYPRQIIGQVFQLKRSGQIINLENFYLFQSTLYFREIIKIVRLMEKHKINYVFLKGLPLYLHVIEAHPNKIYADCDLLIDIDQLAIAEKLLNKAGFIKHETYYSPFHKYFKVRSEEAFFSKKIKQIRINLDIHYEANYWKNHLGTLNVLYSQSNIDKLTSSFLREKKFINLYGSSLPILSPANLVIFLLLHYFHHNFKGVFRLSFIDKVIRKEKKIDWKEMAIKIEEYKLNNYVYPGLLLLKKYFLTPVDGDIMSVLKPGRRESAFIQDKILKENIFNDEERIFAGIKRFKYIFILSTEQGLKKLMIFLYPKVIYSAFWILYRKLMINTKIAGKLKTD